MLTLAVTYPKLNVWPAALLALAVVVLASAANAECKGQLIVAGKGIPLTNAYAYLTKGFFDETKNDTVVLLTDAAVTDAVVHDHFALSRMADEGKLHFVQATVNPAGQVINFSVGHNGFQFAPGGGSTEHKFEPKARDAKNISGTLLTAGPQKGPMGGPAYEYKAEFATAVQPKR
ncbi:MAG: hypothetical protein M3Z32_01625 [Acidobacteriota bacterium]|nr:hypothetical protein [Acidobacteriota bacterium]